MPSTQISFIAINDGQHIHVSCRAFMTPHKNKKRHDNNKLEGYLNPFRCV